MATFSLLSMARTGSRMMAMRAPSMLCGIQLRTAAFVPRRGRVNQDTSRPGRKLTAKEKQDMRRRARIERFAPAEEEIVYGIQPITDLIRTTAEDMEVPIEYVDKIELNELTSNQLHQGVALRVSGLEPTHLTSLTQYNNGRSAHYFGIDGVLVCRKNSSPFSPVCSKASAGALEAARTNGWAVIGATAAPRSQDIQPKSLIPMNKLGKTEQGVILVLGNEGYGLRAMVRKKCSHHVAIPSTNEHRSPLIDSLNVSVATAILLNSFMRNRLEGKLEEFENMVPLPNPLNIDSLEDDIDEEEDDDE
ncbi:Alpha/beta knot methyltransferase [Syncephalis fuscata]|nr:Alpha/beta knot methyltransferase [Syncephalis fuscata]